MKTVNIHSAILFVLPLILLSCTKESYIGSNNSDYFEIYLAKNQIVCSGPIDYSQIRLDTIDLEEIPFLTAVDIASYDTVNHIINLNKPKSELAFPPPGVYGQMFVVMVDKNPEYCGFFWTILSSATCNWIFIEDTNTLTDKQIQINAGYPNFSYFHGDDPRNSPTILNSLSKLGKLTGGKK